jgi:ClpP class serine protease
LIVHALGGLVLASLRIAHAICAPPVKVTVHVPHYAMSVATLIALAAGEIVMDRRAVLGPVDPQVGAFPAVSVPAAVGRKSIDRVEDRTLILTDIAEKAIARVKGAVKQLLLEHIDEVDAERAATRLSTGSWTHDHSLTADVAKLLGLPVSKELDPMFYDQTRLYPQPVRQHAAVECLPTRCKREEEPPVRSKS